MPSLKQPRNFQIGIKVRGDLNIVSVFYISEPNSLRRCLVNLHKITEDCATMFSLENDFFCNSNTTPGINQSEILGITKSRHAKMITQIAFPYHIDPPMPNAILNIFTTPCNHVIIWSQYDFSTHLLHNRRKRVVTTPQIKKNYKVVFYTFIM